MSPSTLRKSLIAAAILGPAAVAGGASAQTVPVPSRPEGFVFVAPDGPSVLEGTVLGPVAPASRPDLARPAVPVAQVMNGGGFGFTGFDYYHDQYSEGRLGERKRPKEYVIAPSWAVPPRD
ncbi:hypothetical protein [Methylobacterium sp. J-076]|uniref:hypothetical protein n=1 Tax=Methylobacterium sp. J-076 TaxID=2836655 RepID=UPI001FBBB330|nr:hypothetical protein [Methylobacterium sp. J-076]MCJ2011401.1 hypothetical protein [Methylobacterium sp. J-076]